MKKRRTMEPAAKAAIPEPLDFSWEEVVPLLMKARGIESGLWSFGVRFNFGAVNAQGLTAAEVLPTGVLSVKGLTLRSAQSPGPLVFDASGGAKRTKTAELSASAARKSPSGAPKPAAVRRIKTVRKPTSS